MVITVNLKANTLNNIYNYNFMDIDGNIINLNAFVGKPILLVKTASKCGFTPQYGDLQILFQNYKNTDSNPNCKTASWRSDR